MGRSSRSYKQGNAASVDTGCASILAGWSATPAALAITSHEWSGDGTEIVPGSPGDEGRPRQNVADVLQVGESDGAFRITVRHCREAVYDVPIKPEQLGACQVKQFD